MKSNVSSLYVSATNICMLFVSNTTFYFRTSWHIETRYSTSELNISQSNITHKLSMKHTEFGWNSQAAYFEMFSDLLCWAEDLQHDCQRVLHYPKAFNRLNEGHKYIIHYGLEQYWFPPLCLLLVSFKQTFHCPRLVTDIQIVCWCHQALPESLWTTIYNCPAISGGRTLAPGLNQG